MSDKANGRTEVLETLYRAASEYFNYMGPCVDDDEDPYCGDPECAYCAMAVAHQAVTETPRTKQ